MKTDNLLKLVSMETNDGSCHPWALYESTFSSDKRFDRLFGNLMILISYGENGMGVWKR